MHLLSVAKDSSWKVIRDGRLLLEGFLGKQASLDHTPDQQQDGQRQAGDTGKNIECFGECSFVAMNRDSQVMGVMYCKGACGVALEIEKAPGQRQF